MFEEEECIILVGDTALWIMEQIRQYPNAKIIMKKIIKEKWVAKLIGDLTLKDDIVIERIKRLNELI